MPPHNESPTPSVRLDHQGHLLSDLWLDENDARRQVEQRVESGKLEDGQGQKLIQFAREGYFLDSIALESSLRQQIIKDIDRLWREKPVDLAYSFVREPCSMADSHQRRERRPTYRIYNLHSHSEALRDLYLHRGLHGWAEMLLGGEPVALGTIFGEFGSRQPFVRDAVNVDAPDPARLVTAWVALDEVSQRTGPPVVIPRSQHLPFYQYEEGRISIGRDEDYLEGYRFLMLALRDAGLREHVLTFAPGQVLFRHSGLVHGAKPVRDPHTTRRFVEIHFTRRDLVERRGAAFLKRVRGKLFRSEERFFWAETDRLLEKDGCQGFDNPLRGLHPRGLTLWEKLAGKLGR